MMRLANALGWNSRHPFLCGLSLSVCLSHLVLGALLRDATCLANACLAAWAFDVLRRPR